MQYEMMKYAEIMVQQRMTLVAQIIIHQKILNTMDYGLLNVYGALI